MANPGSITSQLPQGDDYLIREIQDIKRQLRELEPSIARSFSGTVAKLNDAIASTIDAQASVAGVNGSTFTPTSTELTHLDFVVPSGYTHALVVSNAVFMAYNGSANPDYVYGQIKVSHGWNSGEVYQFAAAGYSASVAVPFYATLGTLVTGEILTVSAFVRTSSGTWPSNTANQVNVYAQVLFLR